MNRQKIVHEIQLGAVRASIWKNTTFDGPKYTVTVSKVSRHDESIPSSNHFEAEDLPSVADVVDLAHLWICEQAELIA